MLNETTAFVDPLDVSELALPFTPSLGSLELGQTSSTLTQAGPLPPLTIRVWPRGCPGIPTLGPQRATELGDACSMWKRLTESDHSQNQTCPCLKFGVPVSKRK